MSGGIYTKEFEREVKPNLREVSLLLDTHSTASAVDHGLLPYRPTKLHQSTVYNT